MTGQRPSRLVLRAVFDEHGDFAWAHAAKLRCGVQRSSDLSARPQQEFSRLDYRFALSLHVERAQYVDFGLSHSEPNRKSDVLFGDHYYRSRLSIRTGGDHLDAETVEKLDFLLNSGQLALAVSSPSASVKQNVNPRFAKITG